MAIRSFDIKGVWEVEMVAGKSPFSSSFAVKQDSFIPNPSYIPPASTGQKLWFAGKMLGRTMTGVGILLDGASLVSEFQKGRETKNYDGFFRESARVAGGWTGAVALGTTFAKASALACSPLTPIAPWAPPLCGLVGGAVGSVIGYTGGSQIATWGYDIQKTQPKSVSSIIIAINLKPRPTWSVYARVMVQ
ncbi:hypothetical protein [Legionella quinlivanii]|nr:hypothetical protein [Legionella quinlivanii]MCW8450456.1 hypothetical protein [Legionella quinlivanii]